MTCVSIIKWFVLVLVMVSKNQSNKTKTDFLLPRFELGMVDSKSTVLPLHYRRNTRMVRFLSKELSHDTGRIRTYAGEAQ
jgi:hypothetical protein